MKKFIPFFLFISVHLFGQNLDLNQTVTSINDYTISAAELKYAFNKNRLKEETVSFDSLESYLDVYINFKLKVLEAYRRELDSSAAFQEELQGYLAQLKKPYMEGFDQKDDLIQEAFDRMQWEVNASHILIKVLPNASASDTLRAFEKLASIRENIRSKDDFKLAAQQFSEDGSAQNGGELGWFSVFMMVYPFETAAYDTQVDEVSKIIRSQFGYHILYVNDKRKSVGKVQTSHIFFSNRRRSDADCQILAQAVSDSLKNVEKWDELVRQFSDDGQTKMKGGALPFAGSRQLPEEFLSAAYQLEIGEISEPIQTDFGWHIIRLDQVQAPPTFDQIRPQIEEQIQRSGRNQLSHAALIDYLKKKYNYTESDDLKEILNKSVSSSSSDIDTSSVLFRVDHKELRLLDFQAFKSANSRASFDQFVEDELKQYADSMAPYDYPDYGFLLKEYEEGLLLFEIMQSEVWNKAVDDSIGLVNYYQKHINQYASPRRFEIFEIKANGSDEEAAMFQSLSDLTTGELLDSLEKVDSSELKIAKSRRELSELSSFENFISTPGHIFKKDELLYVVGKEIPAGYYELDEIRGRLISNYQEELDQELIRSLRKKSKIKTKKGLLRKLLDELG